MVEQIDTAEAARMGIAVKASLGMAAGVGAEQHTVVMKLAADKVKNEAALLPALPRETKMWCLLQAQ